MISNRVSILNRHVPTAQQSITSPTKVLEHLNNKQQSIGLNSLRPTDWLILRVVGDLGEAKGLQIKQATGLATSTVLKSAQKLHELGKLARRIEPGTENRSKPPFLFSLPPGVTPESIEAEIQELGISVPNPNQESISKSRKNLGSATTERHRDTSDASSLIAKIIQESEILGGCTATEIIQRTGLATGVVQGYLSRSFRRGKITRVRNMDKSALEYIYKPVANTDDSSSNDLQPRDKDRFVSETNQLLEETSMNDPGVTESSQDAVGRASSTQTGIWEVVKAMAERIIDLENRFEQLELALKGDSNPNADEILSLLRKKP